jgi:hypothetical protein
MSAQTLRAVGSENPKRGPFQELDGVARALEVPYRGAPELSARVNGTPVRLSLVSREHEGLGRTTHRVVALELELGLESPTDAPPSLSLDLRPETALDRNAKARGLARELELGDPAFDDHVWVGGTVPDAEAKRLLERPKTREAVRELLEGECVRVRVTGDAVTVRWLCSGGVVDTGAVLDGLERALEVARAGGPRGQPAPQHGEWVPGLAMFVFLASVGYSWFVFSDTSPAPWLPLLGVAGGALCGLALRGPIARLVRGDAESRPRYAFASLLAAVGLGLFGGVFVTHLNAALDDAPSETLNGHVASVSRLNSSQAVVEVAWADGTTSRHLLHDRPIGLRRSNFTEGDSVRLVRHPGALGAAWEERLDIRPRSP